MTTPSSRGRRRAGLQLAGLALRHHAAPADRAAFVAAFAGSDRFVVDFLAEEVLQRQPAAVQDFLLRTSVLERLCGPLCDAVLAPCDAGDGGPGPAAPVGGPSQGVLEALERANLFVIPLDRERRWYRYHLWDSKSSRVQQGCPEGDASGMLDLLLLTLAALRANAVAERLIGTLWRECLDHLIVLNERHLHAVLTEFAVLYNCARPHRRLRLETPLPADRPALGPIRARPVLGGLHHTHERAA
jgi:hypothetical protein